MQRRRLNQEGFTLIELVIVIVIIGILAAVAIPKFVTLSDDAKKGVAFGVAAAAASASTSNLALFKGGLTQAKTIASCGNLSVLIDIPNGYSISGPAIGSTGGSCVAGSYDGTTYANTVSFYAYGTT